MLPAIVDLLRCPVCRAALELSDRVLVCWSGHRFDVARQGYANLLNGPQPRNADTSAMVQARIDFLAGGHYDALADALSLHPETRVVVDAGAGPGRYLASVLERLPRARGVACDVAVAACRRAARVHPRAGAVVADTWTGLPVRSGVADAVMVVFAPRNFAEFARALRPEGRLVVAVPDHDHLTELRGALGLIGIQPDKPDRLLAEAAPWFTLTERVTVRRRATLSVTDVANLVGMGPNAFHTDPVAVRARAAAAGPVEVTTAFVVSEFALTEFVANGRFSADAPGPSLPQPSLPQPSSPQPS